MTEKVTKSDWKTKPMPKEPARLSQPKNDEHKESLFRIVALIKKEQCRVEHDVILMDDKRWGAVYFFRTDEPNGFLSNLWRSEFVLDHKKFSSVWQYIMYSKCMLFGDEEAARKVTETDDNNEQKVEANETVGYNDIVWNGMRQILLLRGLLAKFSQNDLMKEALLSTENEYLVACSRHDRIWTCGMSVNEEERKDIRKWKGQNILGFTLMKTRDILKNKSHVLLL